MGADRLDPDGDHFRARNSLKGMFWWKDLEHWNIGWFLFLASYSIVLFMWASMLYPPEFPHGFKCQEYFFQNRVWFFGFGIAAMLMDVVETVEKQVLSLRNVPREYIVFLPLMIWPSIPSASSPATGGCMRCLPSPPSSPSSPIRC